MAASQSSLMVAVRVRPLSRAEQTKGTQKEIVKVMDNRLVLVLDPDESKDYLDQVQNRTKEKRYTFDIALGAESSNTDVYDATVRHLLGDVLNGINVTVFAYGSTGSGKTYTMVGSEKDPGLMVQSLKKIFDDRERMSENEEVDLTCSYLEVYNEVIYDLLVKNSGQLELREDPELGVQVAGLKRIKVDKPGDILALLEEGNKRRKTESTDANAVSSRSHAVLEISIKRTARNHYRANQLMSKLCLVDLAGSERAAETNNMGQKLRDGANINRSLLALANCINALGKVGKNGEHYIPYRNSKLTRLLKDGLSGNSRTLMIANVPSGSDQYHHTINTLKYADRAKEIKTHVVQNVGTVESHVSDYQRIIDNLQAEVRDLRVQLTDTVQAGGASSLTSLDAMIQDMNDNIEERINLQKDLFELDDLNAKNKIEMAHLDSLLAAGDISAIERQQALTRRDALEETIEENETARSELLDQIKANEFAQREVQQRIEDMIGKDQSPAVLSLLNNFRLQAVRVTELKFQMAVRDQIITEQRTVISDLWGVFDKLGMSRKDVMAVIQQQSAPARQPEQGVPQALESEYSSSTVEGDMFAKTIGGNRALQRFDFWSKYHSGGPTAVQSELGTEASEELQSSSTMQAEPRPRRRISSDSGQASEPPQLTSHQLSPEIKGAAKRHSDSGEGAQHSRPASGRRAASLNPGVPLKNSKPPSKSRAESAPKHTTPSPYRKPAPATAPPDKALAAPVREFCFPGSSHPQPPRKANSDGHIKEASILSARDGRVQPGRQTAGVVGKAWQEAESEHEEEQRTEKSEGMRRRSGSGAGALGGSNAPSASDRALHMKERISANREDRPSSTALHGGPEPLAAQSISGGDSGVLDTRAEDFSLVEQSQQMRSSALARLISNRRQSNA